MRLLKPTQAFRRSAITAVIVALMFAASAYGQAPAAARELGSRTAIAGFKNENDIAAKFAAWLTDDDAPSWLRTMGHDLSSITDVATSKPHGEKTDVRVTVTSKGSAASHGISIKLVSSENGFNQIDKRWLRQYATAWKMPAPVVKALRLFAGEDPPTGPSRVRNRMFLTELDPAAREQIVRFFEQNKQMIVEDLLAGDGPDSAEWFLVAWKNSDRPKWHLSSIADTIRFYSEGAVTVTRSGNLRIGRITMQRKGGDGGRETAKMIQFKLNPTAFFPEQ